ncbi:hypothetical protein PO909_025297 [Leuciscus waleckii]
MTSRTKNEQGLQFPTMVNLIFTVVILVSGGSRRARTLCGTWQGGVAKPFLSPFQKQMLPAVWSRDTDRGAPHVKIRSTGLETGEVGEESGMQEYRFTGPTTGTDSRGWIQGLWFNIQPPMDTGSPRPHSSKYLLPPFPLSLQLVRNSQSHSQRCTCHTFTPQQALAILTTQFKLNVTADQVQRELRGTCYH